MIRRENHHYDFAPQPFFFGSDSLGDDRAEQGNVVERRERLRTKLTTLITLFYATERRALFDEETLRLVRTELAALAEQFDVPFLSAPLLSPADTSAHGSSASTIEPSIDQSAPEEAPTEAYQAPVPTDGCGPYTEQTFERLLVPHVIAMHLKHARSMHRTEAEKLQQYERKRSEANANHTLKEWEEQHKQEYRRLKHATRTLSGQIERLLSGHPSAEEMMRIREEIRRDYATQQGTLSAAQHSALLAELTKRAFHEEATNEQFYPTPLPIIERYVLPALDLSEGLSVLEPSAGKGDIADAVRRACPSCGIDVIELNETRQDILRLKGYNVVGNNTVAYQAHRYDRIAMNPPFDGDTGIEHIEHAFRHLLKPGGVLVAIAPASYATSTSNRFAIEFRRNFMERYGSFVGIPVEEYNKGIERPITLHIAVITLTKPLVEAPIAPPAEQLVVKQGDRLIDTVTWTAWQVTKQLRQDEEIAYELTNERTGLVRWTAAINLTRDQWTPRSTVDASDTRRRLAPRKAEARDALFTPPEIVTARPLYTHKPHGFHVDRSILNEQIKPYVIEGANYAIESLDANGGYLLTDGTGTGKTIQQLLVAHHYVKTEKRPVLIITESEQIIQQSFFGDARKLGLTTPDRVDIAERSVPTPRRYKGLYQDCGLADGEKEQALDYKAAYPTFAAGAVTVVRFRPGLAMAKPGIYVGTYNDLSNLRHIASLLTKADDTLTQAQQEKSAANARYSAMRRNPPPGTSKKEWAAEVKEQQKNDPAYSRAIKAEDALWQIEFDEMDRWIKGAACLIYDEAHNLKNTGRGGSLRARRAARLSESAHRVMFVTATPADKPGDTLYLRRSGLYENDEDYEEWMNEIGYYLTEERTNDRGEVIQRAEWKPYSTFGIAQALAGLRTLFDWMTDSRMMLKREIALSNLEPVQMIDVPVPAWIEEYLHTVLAAIVDNAQENDRAASIAEVLMEQKRILEPFKIKKCLQLIDEELAEGRSVVVFADLVEEGTELKPWGRPKAGTIQVLRERLCARYGNEVAVVAGVQGEYEKYKRLANINEFQSGKRRVALCTIGSGGTGISLDDTLGNAPRTIIVLTAPMNSIKSVQLIGRVVRANTRSRSRVKFLFCDVAVDEWLKNILATKLKMLRAIVEGQVRQMTPEEIEKSETDAATNFNEERHSLWDANGWINGETLPQKRPLLVERMRDSLQRWWVRVKGRTREALERVRQEYATMLDAFGFTKESDRYEGTFYQAPYSDEAWNWLLNLLKPESSTVAATPDQLFREGHPVVAARDITRDAVKQGTRGTIKQTRHYGEGWFYTVQWESGTTTTLVRQNHLAPPDLYARQAKVGDRFIQFSKPYTSHRGEVVRGVTLITISSYSPSKGMYTTLQINTTQEEGKPVQLNRPPHTQQMSADHLSELLTAHRNNVNLWEPYRADDPRLQGEGFNTVLSDEAGRVQQEVEALYAEHPSSQAPSDELPPKHLPLKAPPDQTAATPPHDDDTPPHETTPTRNDWRLDNKQALPQVRTFKDIRNQKIKRRSLPECYETLFGRVPERCIFLAHGVAGHGKSTLAMGFAQEIARQESKKGKKVLYVNSEQPSDRGGMTDRALRVNATSEGVGVVDTKEPQHIDALLRTGDYSFVVLDSVNRLRVKNDRELVQFLNALFTTYPDISFFLIAHETKKGGGYKGPSDLAHDAEIVVRVERGIASTEKNHFGPHNAIRVFPWSDQKQLSPQP